MRVAAHQPAAPPPGAGVQALQIVDCLLPGQVRVVGGRTYLTPRRPTRTRRLSLGRPEVGNTSAPLYGKSLTPLR